ncbi:MAG: DUF938 domain-containing protein [Pseudomonadota bacterium]
MNLPCSSAAERNKQPILDVLVALLNTHQSSADVESARGCVLEIASGTGQHIEYFAPHFPALQWVPSEAEGRAFAAIKARTGHLPNVSPPIALDVCDVWPLDLVPEKQPLVAVLVANLFHISPVETLTGFFRGAATVLSSGGLVHVYGPFKCGGAFNSPGDERFDASLRQRDPAWGIRDLEMVECIAADFGFSHYTRRNMPANNLSLSWRYMARVVG